MTHRPLPCFKAYDIRGRLGVELDEAAIPLDHQVAAACELLGLDPLFVANEGVFVTVVPKPLAAAVLQELQQEQAGKNAAIAGFFSPEHPGKILMQNRAGGRRVVPYLAGEQLPRIC